MSASISSADVPALLQARRRRLIWFLLVVLSLIIVVAGARPVYQAAKRWRAHGLMLQARELMGAESWEAAAEKVQAAYQLAPMEPETLRLFATLNSRIGHPRADDLWKKVLGSPNATQEDRIEALQYALKFERFSFAEEQLEAWLKSEPASIDALEFAIRVAALQGDRHGAEEFTARILQQQPDHAFAQLTQARLLLSMADAPSKSQGRHLLETLAFSDSAVSLAALESLAVDGKLADPEMLKVARAIQIHPDATPAVALAGIAFEIALHPTQREALLASAVAKFNTIGTLPALGRWANEMGEYGRVLELIPANASREDLFLVRLDAMTALKRWPDIDAALADEKGPLLPIQRDLYIARTLAQRGGKKAAEVHWNQVIENLQAPSDLFYAAGFAERSGALNIAEKAYRKLARQPAWTKRAWLALVPILNARANTTGLREIISELARLTPGDPALRNEEAYLFLLLNENIAAARETALALTRAYPPSPARQATLALAYLRAGDPSAALKVSQDMEHLSASFRAVRAAVLAANGELKKAHEIADAIPEASLKPEEEQLIAAFR